MNINRLNEMFSDIYGDAANTRCFFAPGRVNLIGEHTDYNGGLVFPCAICFGTYGVARRRSDRLMRFTSANFTPPVDAVLDDCLEYRDGYGWANYLLGVVDQFQKTGNGLSGFECLIAGDIPQGAGLSSSASVELLMAVTLNSLFECGLSMLDMVRISQACENRFVGMNCGIMDQFAVGMGKENCAVLLDCSTLEHEYVPVRLDGHRIVIANTNKSRKLAGSLYNERRAECERALMLLQAAAPDISCLCGLSPERFRRISGAISEPVTLKRATHAVYENDRVKQAVSCLKDGDLPGFGRLMNQSHESLRDLFQVTGLELDTLVSEAWNIDGVLGSRMTGAGFGGCTVSIVRDDAMQRFITEAGDNYTAKTGLQASFYTAEIGGGARVMEGRGYGDF